MRKHRLLKNLILDYVISKIGNGVGANLREVEVWKFWFHQALYKIKILIFSRKYYHTIKKINNEIKNLLTLTHYINFTRITM